MDERKTQINGNPHHPDEVIFCMGMEGHGDTGTSPNNKRGARCVAAQEEISGAGRARFPVLIVLVLVLAFLVGALVVVTFLAAAPD